MANYGPPGGPYPGSPADPWPDTDRQAVDEYGQPADPWGEHDPAGAAGWGGSQPSVPPVGTGSPAAHQGYPEPAGAGHPGPAAAPGPTPEYPPTRQQAAGFAPTPQPSGGGSVPPGGSAPFGAPPPGWTPSGPEPVWAPPAGDPNWSTSTPEPPRKGGASPLLVGLLATLVVLVIGGVVVGSFLFDGDGTPPDTQATAGPSDPPADKSSPSTGPAPTSVAPAPSTDARFVKAGQCVLNEGTEEVPKLTITPCAPDTYEVLARFNGATTGKPDAKTKCAKVEKYTNYYFYNSELDDLDFVLCLRKR